MTLKTFDRESTINWLKTNQENGFFDEFEEANKDFDALSNEELEWYYTNWVCADKQN